MSRPPSDIEPSELWLKLCEPRPSEVIDFPRRDRQGNPVGKVRIQVLTMDDHNRARIVAQQVLKRSAADYGIPNMDKADMDSPAVREVLGDLVAHELLCMACLSDKATFEETEEKAAVYGRIFRTAEDLRSRLTADETLVLFNAYMLVQHKYGPFERTLNEDGDLEAWVQRLEEGGSAFPLLALSLPDLVGLTSSMAARISLLSHTLESQWERLPDSSKSALAPFCMGMFSSGEPRDESTRISLESSPEIRLADALRMSEDQKSARSEQ